MQRIPKQIMNAIKSRLVAEAPATASITSLYSTPDRNLPIRCKHLFSEEGNVVVVTGKGSKLVRNNNGISFVATNETELAEAIEELSFYGKLDFVSANPDFLRNIIDRAVSELSLSAS